jgi:glycosyltransferase involved in cell wall biosynthesis
LESVRPLIDCLHISDTGSTDNTVDLICDFMKKYDIPGTINHDKWADFATNRNLSLQWLRRQAKPADYAFVIDADDTLEISLGPIELALFKRNMDRDIYDLQVHHAGVIHPRPQIFRNTAEYYWRGALHEYLEKAQPFSRAPAPGLIIHASIEGSRNADPKKFHKDAGILKKALKTEKNGFLRARYTFYLAQSYRDAEDPQNALRYYLKRSKMGFYDQEVYIALLEAIRCCTKLGEAAGKNTARDCYNLACDLKLSRAEHHHAMAFLSRQHGENEVGMAVASDGLRYSAPNGLFIQPWIYDYGLRDEFAVNAYWAGHYRESLEASLKLLASDKIPFDMVKRLADNSLAALEKIPTPPPAPEPMFLFSD